MSHLPRVPVRFIEQNSELLENLNKAVDHKFTESIPQAFSAPTYRTPPDRVHGNEAFRRNPDGSINIEYACHKVVDAIHKVRDNVPLTSLEQAILSCVFPSTFRFVESGIVESIRAVNLRLTLNEVVEISMAVASHLAKEVEFKLSSHAR